MIELKLPDKDAVRQTIQDARKWSEVPFVMQPNPRWPLHYRFRARLLQVGDVESATFTVTTQLTEHYWSWSLGFWRRILLAWLRHVLGDWRREN